MDSTIHYREMINEMEAADHETGKKTFSLVYLDCNRTKKTGGNWIREDRARKSGLPYHCAGHEMRGLVLSSGKIIALHLRLVFEFNGRRVIQ